MRILICDDDKLFSAQLQKCITEFFRRNKIKVPDIIVYVRKRAIMRDFYLSVSSIMSILYFCFPM